MMKKSFTRTILTGYVFDLPMWEVNRSGWLDTKNKLKDEIISWEKNHKFKYVARKVLYVPNKAGCIKFFNNRNREWNKQFSHYDSYSLSNFYWLYGDEKSFTDANVYDGDKIEIIGRNYSLEKDAEYRIFKGFFLVDDVEKLGEEDLIWLTWKTMVGNKKNIKKIPKINLIKINTNTLTKLD